MQDMPALGSGDIVPGESISMFRLGTTWAELRGSLIGAYAVQQRRGSFAVKTATLWFLIDDVAEHLGRWSEDEDDCIVVAAVPGVCFELGHVPRRDLEWQLHHAPIEYISVYSGHRGRAAA